MNCSVSDLGLVAIVRGCQCRHNPLAADDGCHASMGCPVPLGRASTGLLDGWQIVS